MQDPQAAKALVSVRAGSSQPDAGRDMTMQNDPDIKRAFALRDAHKAIAPPAAGGESDLSTTISNARAEIKRAMTQLDSLSLPTSNDHK